MRRGRLGRLVLAGLILAGPISGLATLLPGRPAWAHTQLVAAVPARNATLTAAPPAVTLEFTDRLNPDFTTIVVSDAANRRVTASAPAIDRTKGTVTFGQSLANGTYTVAYRVVSVDGHTVQGSYPFTVADPARPAPTVSAVPVAAPPAGQRIPAGVPIALAGAGVLLVAAAAYFLRGPRKRRAG